MNTKIRKNGTKGGQDVPSSEITNRKVNITIEQG